MPVYNAERLLGECLAALESSTFRDYEILVVDDTSTDGLARDRAAYGCRVIPTATARPAGARNKGVEQAPATSSSSSTRTWSSDRTR